MKYLLDRTSTEYRRLTPTCVNGHSCPVCEEALRLAQAKRTLREVRSRPDWKYAYQANRADLKYHHRGCAVLDELLSYWPESWSVWVFTDEPPSHLQVCRMATCGGYG